MLIYDDYDAYPGEDEPVYCGKLFCSVVKLITVMIQRHDGTGIELSWRSLPIPMDWENNFGRTAPLELEIGFGNGEFLVSKAQTELSADFVGIDIAAEYVRRACNRSRMSGLTNVRLVRIEGGRGLSRLFPAGSLRAIYINFPDPWNRKKKQKKNRLVDISFVQLAASRLAIGGTIEFVSDVEDYAGQARAAFECCESFKVMPSDIIGNETKYGRKWAAAGRAFHNVSFRKFKSHEVGPSLLATYPLVGLGGNEKMPHVWLNGPVDFGRAANSIPKGEVWRDQDIVVKVMEVLVRHQDDGLSVDVLLAEGKLLQRFFVQVSSRRGKTMVGLHPATHADVTPGVQLAVGWVGKIVAESCEATISSSTVGATANRQLVP